MSINRNPQNVMGGKAWYYETRESIEVIVPPDSALNIGGNDTRVVRIPRRMLEKSLQRMRPKRMRRVATEKAARRRKATN